MLAMKRTFCVAYEFPSIDRSRLITRGELKLAAIIARATCGCFLKLFLMSSPILGFCCGCFLFLPAPDRFAIE